MVRQIDQQLACHDLCRKLKEENYELKARVKILENEIRILQNKKAEDVAEELKHRKESEENKELFEKLDHIITKDRLFLDPDLTRDRLLKIIHVDKNRFAQIIQQNTQTNLAGYINSLRLDYAVKMMEQYPECLIQSVAIECGIPNSGTFYRLFRERYGVTPAEYRVAMKEVEI